MAWVEKDLKGYGLFFAFVFFTREKEGEKAFLEYMSNQEWKR